MNNFQWSKEEKIHLIPWAEWPKIEVITNNDGDGLVSLLFLLNHPKTKNRTVMKGLYTLDKMYLVEKKDRYRLDKMIGIDLDMQIKGMHCLGHHMNISFNENSLNANDLFGISTNMTNNYTRKCPLNTLFLLYWLFNQRVRSDREIAFLVYWDSVLYNYEHYKSNVTNWLKKLGFEEVLDGLENRLDAIKEIIQKEILPYTLPFKTGYEKSGMPQCTILPSYDRANKRFFFSKNSQSPKTMEAFLTFIRRYTGWDTSKVATEFACRENYVYTTFSIGQDFDVFKEQLKSIQEPFISSAVTLKDQFRLTTKTSVTKEAELAGLIITDSSAYMKKTYPDKKPGQTVAFKE